MRLPEAGAWPSDAVGIMRTGAIAAHLNDQPPDLSHEYDAQEKNQTNSRWG